MSLRHALASGSGSTNAGRKAETWPCRGCAAPTRTFKRQHEWLFCKACRELENNAESAYLYEQVFKDLYKAGAPFSREQWRNRIAVDSEFYLEVILWAKARREEAR